MSDNEGIKEGQISLIKRESRGFKVFYNRRYFLNFRRYLKN
jgi:hypothetical protein